MSNTSYLSMMSSKALWRAYFHATILSELGLGRDFDLNLPQKTENFITTEAEIFSKKMEREGMAIGKETVKNFQFNRTRFSPEQVSNLWQFARIEFQNRIERSQEKDYADGDLNLVPGIKEIKKDNLTPKTEGAKRLWGSESTENINRTLLENSEKLSRDIFWSSARNLTFENWSREFYLYKEQKTDPEIKAK